MNEQYALWEKYLLYTILKRTISEKEQVEEVAAFFDCLPTTFIREGWVNNGMNEETREEDLQEDEEDTGKLVIEICEPNIRKSLLADFYGMDAKYRRIIEKFWTDPLFCDAIISFCGFASSVRLHLHQSSAYPLDVLLRAFNDRALEFFCIELEFSDLKFFLDICGDALGLNPEEGSAQVISGWTYYLATWAVIRGRCSFWSHE